MEIYFSDINKNDEVSLDSIKGHNGLKYSMAVAVAGRHNILAYGGPGCGKTMVLQHLPELMPKLLPEESKSVTRIHSIAGLLRPEEGFKTVRPFRMPHQTASIEGICGGGPSCRPGEISLAHNGVLFLNEAAEFRSSVLQMLRIPLETGNITLSRAGRTTVYPARFQLAMTTNLCPCGNYGSPDKVCLCSMKSVEMYWKKFSASLLDRVGIRFDCNAEYSSGSFSLEELRKIIKTAWEVQYKRQGKLNQDLKIDEVNALKISEFAKKVLNEATEKYGYSPRGISNILKIARTLQDMRGIDDRASPEIDDIAMRSAIRFHGKLPIDFE